MLGGAAESLQDTFSAKEQSAGFRQSKTPKPMQVLRAAALSRARKCGQEKLGFTDITWFTVRLQFCISKTAVNKILGMKENI
ncbi:MAG: hypothetical protein ACTTJ1_09655 [Treponema sp.]